MDMKIKTAVVLHEGWEMDNLAWVSINEEGELKLSTTSHGGYRKMTKKALIKKIKETEASLNQLQGLLTLIKHVKGIS